MAGSWSMSVLIGPLVGGMFASFGNWRNAFLATTVVAGILAVSAFFILPSAPAAGAAGKAAGRRACPRRAHRPDLHGRRLPPCLPRQHRS